MNVRRASHRGMTLIELLISLGAASLAAVAIFSVVIGQQRIANKQLPISEAQQNARSSLSLLRRYLRDASYGVRADAAAAGFATIGACYDTADFRLQQFNCDNVDTDNRGVAGVDRLQLAYIKPIDGNYTKDNLGTDISLFSMEQVNSLDAASVAMANHPFAVGSWLLVSGTCASTAVKTVDLLRVTGAQENPASSLKFRYIYGDTLGTTTTNCGANRYIDNMAVGQAQFIDINLIDGTLFLRTDPTIAPVDGFVVARNIDDFQVQYLLDILDQNGAPGTDGVVDTTCDDLSDVGCAGILATVRAKANRVIAVRVAIVVRTAVPDSTYLYGTPTDMVVQNHTGNGTGDGYLRWVYRTTVVLRNNQL